MNSNNCASLTSLEKQPPDGTYTHKALRIRYDKHLASMLGLSKQALLRLEENAQLYYREFKRDVKGKQRTLVEATRPLKTIQRRILDNILLRLPLSESSFGQGKNRTIKDNARVHAHSKFIVKLDIKDFYPSIHSTKVYDFFIRQECSPDVAHILTALTTYNYCLPLGTSTSPMLADQIVRPIDRRINGMAAKVGLKYTRYVDDLTLSGNFPVDRLARTVMTVLRQSGFKPKKDKLIFYKPLEVGEERVVTGVRISDGRLSAPLDYISALETELNNAIQESKRNMITREFHPREHYRGKIGYVKWLNPKQGQRLLPLYRKVKWRHLEWAAGKQ